ncbi:MAG: TonB-dependent receptor [Caulobacteraceae bacterium]|nr:TonB-dependent receptor [Caulobacteraceae bacterium]
MGFDAACTLWLRAELGFAGVGFLNFRRTAPLRWTALSLATAIPACALAADLPSSPPNEVSELVVTSQRLNEARASIQPQIGASVYTITSQAIAAMPGGENVALNQVVLQSPGVVQDSFGQLHVRGEHNGLQFRLNGVILPEGLSVFGQALSPRLADKVQLITGSLPAQYGLRTAGIIDITTKSGVFANGGNVSVHGGSHGEIEPSFEYGGSSGNLNFYASGSYFRSDLGIESPDGRSTPLHDHTDQFQGFAYFEDIIDPSSKVSLILGASNQRFQIPDVTGQTPFLMFGSDGDQPLVVDGRTTFPSEDLNESQKEATYYAVASYLHTSERFTGQLSLFARYSSLKFIPDSLGDLLFNGIAQDAYKRDVSGGFQAEGVYRLTEAHTLRGGVIGQIDRGTSNTSSQVIPLDADNSQTTDQPLTIVDDGAKTAYTISVYLQDEWKVLSNLTFNYGLRFDEFDGFRNENQVSPRVNLVWLATPSTTFHAGYSRYFSPAPFELVGTQTVAKFAGTTAASETTTDTTPYAERANYFDAGVSQALSRDVTVAVDSYYKTARHLIDEGQFGAPVILTPFNYLDGRQYGVELTGTFNHGPFSAYANFAYVKNQGRDIVSSEFNFSPDDLAYIRTHYIYLDHDQTYTASAGVSYLWRGTRVGGDLIYGSGLRTSGADGVPNGVHLPGYVQVNLSLAHRFEIGPLGPLAVRVDLINAFDEIYQIRDGSGIGVGPPQFGARRGVFAGLTQEF